MSMYRLAADMYETRLKKHTRARDVHTVNSAEDFPFPLCGSGRPALNLCCSAQLSARAEVLVCHSLCNIEVESVGDANELLRIATVHWNDFELQQVLLSLRSNGKLLGKLAASCDGVLLPYNVPMDVRRIPSGKCYYVSSEQ